MRALIVLLSVLVIALAVLILLDRPAPARSGPTFDATQLVADTQPGESATYTDERGETWSFKVDQVIPAAPDRPPQIQVWSIRKDRHGNPLPGGSQVYTHLPTRHGLFPLMAPQDPDGRDRVWVWSRIQRLEVPWQGKSRPAWRFDLIDPALPEEGGADHVVAWLDESVPVFGLLKWQRRDRTWVLTDWSPR